jgi:hypothetical protein
MDGLSRYAYVANDPLGKRDRRGLAGDKVVDPVHVELAEIARARYQNYLDQAKGEGLAHAPAGALADEAIKADFEASYEGTIRDRGHVSRGKNLKSNTDLFPSGTRSEFEFKSSNAALNRDQLEKGVKAAKDSGIPVSPSRAARRVASRSTTSVALFQPGSGRM